MIARPAHALVEPLVLDQAFADPELLTRLIDAGSPYRTLAAVHRDPAHLPVAPWFRNFWALGGKVVFPGAEAAFDNPNYIEAAKDLFGASVVSPLAMMTNLNLPGPDSPPHLDLPFFRGAHKREVPSWMLAPMGYSGLFQRWAIPVASAITWFYDGPGGEFEFWPDGPDQPSVRHGELGSNQAIMADNEYTYHRVCKVGTPDRYVADNSVPYGSELRLDDNRWLVEDEGQTIASFERGAVRVSVLWKAFCFADQDQATAFTAGSDNLTPAKIVELFQNDLLRRGISVEPPSDLEGTCPWAQTIRDTYGAGIY